MQRTKGKVWYLLEAKSVKGPMALEDLPDSPSIQVWRPGLNEWIHTNLNEMKKNSDLSPPEEIACDYFYVRANGFDTGPYSTFEICEKLNSKEFESNIKVWTLGMKRWTALFEYPDLIRRWGITRRKLARVPLVSNVTLTDSGGKKWLATASTISEGGIGVKGFSGFPGGNYNITIRSEFLEFPVVIKTRFIYQSADVSAFEVIEKDKEAAYVLRKYVNRFMTLDQITAA